MSHLLVLGGSGRTGSHVLRHAVARGHHVRALVRNPAAVRPSEQVELIRGTPADLDDLREAAHGTDAVISALSNPPPFDHPTFMTDATRNALTAMGEQGIHRIVLTSGMGAGDDWAHLSPAVKAVITLAGLTRGYADHHGVDHVVRASGTEWTLARGVRLTDRPARGPVRAAERGSARPGTWLSRADFAAFLLDAVEQRSWIGRAPLVWNAPLPRRTLYPSVT